MVNECSKCHRIFREPKLQESHDIPCYLFIYSGNRKGQKNEADKFGRHWLCKDCHEKYDEQLNSELKELAETFAGKFYGNNS